jgi:hypothetical protein
MVFGKIMDNKIIRTTRNLRRSAVHYFFLFYITVVSVLSSHNWIECIAEHPRFPGKFCVNIWILPTEILIIPFQLVKFENLKHIKILYIQEYLAFSVFLNMIIAIYIARFVNYIIDKMTYVEKNNG